jgi:oligoribonuclease NrnB/cAMP/cGMP phosphodiesterase (DHH superfamily)
LGNSPNSTIDNSVLCIYHDDMDGECSAAIVRRKFGDRAVFQSMDYGDAIPWDLIEKCDELIIVDFSFPRADMLRVVEETKVTWVDHHKTSLSELADLEGLPGLRSLGQAACVLTWRLLLEGQPIPPTVLFIADRDIWRHEHEESKPFGEGLFHEDTRPQNDDLWEPLLNGNEEKVSELIARGEIIYQARILRLRKMIKAKGYEIRFEGHPTLAINYRGSGDLGELIREMGYDIAYCYYESKLEHELRTFVSLYSEKIDVSEIARKFGGGGHPGAAGFSFVRTDTPYPPKAVVSPDGWD